MAIGPGLGPRLKKCGLRPTRPIVARFRLRNKTRPKKTRPKAKWAIGCVFMSYGRVLKTRPQNPFFVVSLTLVKIKLSPLTYDLFI